MIKGIILCGFILFALLTAYVRLSKVDASAYHVTTEVSNAAKSTKGVFRSIANADMMSLVLLIEATPRTTRLAGQPEDGTVTYVTRSLIWGFPDVTTIWRDNDRITLHARQRFGLYDFGVNAKRVDAWLASL